MTPPAHHLFRPDPDVALDPPLCGVQTVEGDNLWNVDFPVPGDVELCTACTEAAKP